MMKYLVNKLSTLGRNAVNTGLALLTIATFQACDQSPLDIVDLASRVKEKGEVCWIDKRLGKAELFDRNIEGWCLKYEDANSFDNVNRKNRLIMRYGVHVVDGYLFRTYFDEGLDGVLDDLHVEVYDSGFKNYRDMYHKPNSEDQEEVVSVLKVFNRRITKK